MSQARGGGYFCHHVPISQTRKPRLRGVRLILSIQGPSPGPPAAWEERSRPETQAVTPQPSPSCCLPSSPGHAPLEVISLPLSRTQSQGGVLLSGHGDTRSPCSLLGPKQTQIKPIKMRRTAPLHSPGHMWVPAPKSGPAGGKSGSSRLRFGPGSRLFPTPACVHMASGTSK